jgi:hypothetical protein
MYVSFWGERSAIVYIPNHRGEIDDELLAEWQADFQGALDIHVSPSRKGVVITISASEMDYVDLERLRWFIRDIVRQDVETYYVVPRTFDKYAAFYRRKVAA